MTLPILFDHPWTVRFVDTDASSFAHFSSYFRMMEEAEYAFLRSRGLSVVLPDEGGVLGFPRLSAEIEIYQPLRLEQSVVVKLSLVEIDGKKIVYQFEMLTEDENIAAQGKFTVALCRFPADQPPYAVLIPAAVVSALLDA